MPKSLKFNLPANAHEILVRLAGPDPRTQTAILDKLPKTTSRNHLAAAISGALKFHDLSSRKLRDEARYIAKELKRSKLAQRLRRTIRRELQPIIRILSVNAHGSVGQHTRRMLRETHDGLEFILSEVKQRPAIFDMPSDRTRPISRAVRMLAALDVWIEAQFCRTRDPAWKTIVLNEELLAEICDKILFNDRDTLGRPRFLAERRKGRDEIMCAILVDPVTRLSAEAKLSTLRPYQKKQA